MNSLETMVCMHGKGALGDDKLLRDVKVGDKVKLSNGVAALVKAIEETTASAASLTSLYTTYGIIMHVASDLEFRVWQKASRERSMQWTCMTRTGHFLGPPDTQVVGFKFNGIGGAEKSLVGIDIASILPVSPPAAARVLRLRLASAEEQEQGYLVCLHGTTSGGGGSHPAGPTHYAPLRHLRSIAASKKSRSPRPRDSYEPPDSACISRRSFKALL